MPQQSIWKPVVLATLISGTLDILWAMGLTLYFGREIPGMLRFVASGPFPAATEWGTQGALLGLIVHFSLMAIMAAVYMAAAARMPMLLRQPIKWGALYGVVTYIVLNLIVVPLRFGNFPPKPVSIATQLFAHVVLVGIVFALIAHRHIAPVRNADFATS